MNDLNLNEFSIGMLFGLAMTPIIGPASTVLAFLTGSLWAIGGAGYGRIWRYAGVPTITFFFLVLHSNFYACLVSSIICGALLTIGYGIPDESDEGSALGRFWMKAFHNDTTLANIFTRGTIYTAIAIGYIPCLIFRR